MQCKGTECYYAAEKFSSRHVAELLILHAIAGLDIATNIVALATKNFRGRRKIVPGLYSNIISRREMRVSLFSQFRALNCTTKMLTVPDEFSPKCSSWTTSVEEYKKLCSNKASSFVRDYALRLTGPNNNNKTTARAVTRRASWNARSDVRAAKSTTGNTARAYTDLTRATGAFVVQIPVLFEIQLRHVGFGDLPFVARRLHRTALPCPASTAVFILGACRAPLDVLNRRGWIFFAEQLWIAVVVISFIALER